MFSKAELQSFSSENVEKKVETFFGSLKVRMKNWKSTGWFCENVLENVTKMVKSGQKFHFLTVKMTFLDSEMVHY